MSNNKKIPVEKSKFFHIYIHEVWRLATEIIVNCEYVFNEAKVPDEGYSIQVSSNIHSHIIYVLINSANLKKMIFTLPNRGKDESKKQYEFRLERSNLLKQLFNGIDITEIKNNKVRNTLEHFDEYIDKENLKFSGCELDSGLRAAYNMTLSDWDVFFPRVYPIRLYVANEKKFYNMNFSIDIGKIYEEAKAIIDRMKSLEIFKNEDEAGGLLLVL